MPKRSSKLPRDPNQLAAHIVAMSIGQINETSESVANTKNPAAVALGRLGGLKGGSARANSLTPQKRSEIAKKAAEARWQKGDGNSLS